MPNTDPRIDRLYGLLGQRLEHSFSQRYFRQKFADLEASNRDYLLFELPSIDRFPGLLSKHPHLCGLNVTIPYKETVIPFLDELAGAAASIRAVNTIVFRKGKKLGYNTDVIGFAETLKPFLPLPRGSAAALVLGTGGASKAVNYVLEKEKLDFRMVSRQPKGGQMGYDELGELDWTLPRLIINTTPLGMHPDTDAAPHLPYEKLHSGHIVIDLIYNPLQTRLLALAEAAGCRTANGLHMLHQQAEASWRLWESNSPNERNG